ncbi:MAG: transcriptional regulator GlxA family with amidase domain [Planctomycetota bacterium]|jgi:transcriptional regulator GlxA family with amidase domain
MNIDKPVAKPEHFGFLQVPNYSMIAFSSAIEPLRMANRDANKELYRWTVYTLDGLPEKASNGLEITPDASIENADELAVLFVCGGDEIAESWSKQLQFSLRRIAKRNNIKIGALCTGSYLLARAGLLDGYKCTIHWENIASLREDFPNVQVTDDLFQFDRDRITCAGGQSSMDMMLKLIQERHGSKLVTHISEQFMCERVRNSDDRQRVPLHLALGSNQPKLTEAVTLMEANIEEPISLDELSSYVGISRRQLERLFQKHLNCVPTRYYLNLRLNRARLLLLQTSKSIVDIALACGFISAPHFSKCYRDLFGIPPRDERRKLQASRAEVPPAPDLAS